MEEIPKDKVSLEQPPEEQQPTRGEESTPAVETSEPQVHLHTYHCICTNLVLATARVLDELPRRGQSAQDNAIILPCPPLPRRLVKHMRAHAAGEEQSEQESSESEDGDEDETENEVDATRGKKSNASVGDLVIPVSMPRAAGATIVRRSDGFEKRWLMRCSRCRLVIGYQLDWGQFNASVSGSGADGAGSAEEKKGRREDVMYILPGALRTTDEMVLAKKVPDDQVGFGLQVEDET